MNRSVFVNIFRFLALLFIQIVLLKNAGYYNLAIPFLYILFILLLPFKTPNILLFPLAFITGLTVDVFYDTPGINAAACTLLAFVRIIFINITVQQEGFDNEPVPNMSNMGFRWFFFYAVVLTFFHHVTLFLLETFSFAEIQYTLVRVVLSTLLTVFLILLYELIFFKKKERR